MSIPHGTMALRAVDVTAEAVLLEGANQSRYALLVVNNGADTVYVGLDDVTDETGIPVKAGQSLSLGPPFVTAQAIYACTSGATVNVRVVEFS